MARFNVWKHRASTTGTLLGLALFVLSGADAAFAQGAPSLAEPNIYPDELGVNFTSGAPYLPGVSVAIGSESAGGLTFRRWRSLEFDVWWEDGLTSYAGDISYAQYIGNTRSIMTLGKTYRYFLDSNSTSQPLIPDGSFLVKDSSNYYQTLADGSIANFDMTCKNTTGRQITGFGYDREVGDYAIQVVRPSGEKIKYTYLTLYDGSGCVKAHRLQSIKNNFGYQIHFDYASDQSTSRDWRQVSAITAINNTVDYCDEASLTCSELSQTWPKIQFSKTLSNGPPLTEVQTVTDPTGVVTVYNYVTGTDYHTGYPPEISITINKAGSEYIKYNLSEQDDFGRRVLSSIQTSQSWSYELQGLNTTYQPDTMFKYVRTNPSGGSKSVTYYQIWGQPLSYKDENNNETKYIYNSSHQLKYVIYPEGQVDGSGNPTSGYKQYDRDARNNVLTITSVPKAGSGLSNITESFGFDTTCANPKTCNQPNWSRDGRGNQTDFTYAAAHGGLLSEMRPAPTAGAARPLTLKTYSQRYAWIKNSSGTLVQAADPVWMIATSTDCQTVAGSNSAVCDGSATQTLTTYEYGASGTSEAMLVKGIAVASGGTTLRTCYSYDVFHRRVSETKPNANLVSCP